MSCTVPLWGGCGSDGQGGDRGCCASRDTLCYRQSQHYSQCRRIGDCEGECALHSPPTPPALPMLRASPPASHCTVKTWGSCHSESNCCAVPSDSCFVQSRWYSQCRPSCPIGQGWDCERESVENQATSSLTSIGQAIEVPSSDPSLPINLGIAGGGILLTSVLAFAYQLRCRRALPPHDEAPPPASASMSTVQIQMDDVPHVRCPDDSAA